MKTLILLIAAIFGMTAIAGAQTNDSLTLKPGQTRVARQAGLSVKFVSVVEDSRCPVGVNCIWAGNAQIKVLVTDARGSKLMTMNTMSGPQGDQYGGWAIRLVELTPQPNGKRKTAQNRYRAVISVERLTR